MRFRAVCGLVLAGAVVASAALAAGSQVTNKAQVGVSGRNTTRGYSPSLYVVFVSPPDYNAGCCTDVDSGEWNGPHYQASGNPALGGTAKLSWKAVFDDSAATPEAAVRTALVQHWPDAGQGALAVRHTTGGRTVGTIPGFTLVTRSPETSSAQAEDALAFPLCRGLTVVAEFSALEPFTDSTGGVAGEYQVNGTRASTYNQQQLQTALAGVSLDGYLPIGKLASTDRKGIVTGRLTDCRGHSMPGVTIRAGSRKTKTDANGRFKLGEPGGKGRTFVLSASAGGSTSKIKLACKHKKPQTGGTTPKAWLPSCGGSGTTPK